VLPLLLSALWLAREPAVEIRVLVPDTLTRQPLPGAKVLLTPALALPGTFRKTGASAAGEYEITAGNREVRMPALNPLPGRVVNAPKGALVSLHAVGAEAINGAVPGKDYQPFPGLTAGLVPGEYSVAARDGKATCQGRVTVAARQTAQLVLTGCP
jgi:hypothetical protein